MAKSTDAFRTIGEVSDDLEVPKHVLRFWEGKFPQLKPMKRGGGRRFYRPEDVILLRGIKQLLHSAGYTIKGVQRILRDEGVDAVKKLAAGGLPAPSPKPSAALAPASPSPFKRGAHAKATSAHLSADVRAHLAELLREVEACLIVARGDKATATSEKKAGAKGKR